MAVAVAAAVFAPYAQSAVSLKNGNFYVVYNDIMYPGGFEPKVERVYNSKTIYYGIFGHGWGVDYEAYLRVSADGSVIVHEYGGGAENRFSPINFNEAELNAAVEKIAQTAKSMGKLGSEAQFNKYKADLKGDARFRNKEWEALIKSGKIQARALPVGAQLKSNRFSYQFITRVADGYVRTYDNGRIEKFNNQGRLMKISDKNNNFIELTYDASGKIAKIQDNYNRKIFFTFNNKGLVEKVEGEDKKKSVYEYNQLNELVKSTDSENNTYVYKYTTDQKHNMAEIMYSDKTTLQMAYYGSEGNDNIKSVKQRDGTVTEYAYEFTKNDIKFYAINVTVKGTDKKEISKSRYEYSQKVRPDGEAWTQKMVSVVDGERTETIYGENHGLPVSIKQNGEETSFEYDIKGHVTKKVTPAEVTTVAYDPKLGRVTRVQNQSRTEAKNVNWSEFQYDPKGNLTFARNSDKKTVKLIYDNNGRIRSLVDQDKKQITFKYNEQSKPIEITESKLGTIRVEYTKSGEIKKVDSTGGRNIAVEVTTSFQNLLDIIRPAGVSLTF